MRGRFRSPTGLLPLLACLLLPGVGQAQDTSQVLITFTPDGAALDWSDAEERIQGTVTPADPRAGQDLTVLIHVGSFEGPPFDGPVRLGLRGPDGSNQTQVVRQRDRGWRAVFRAPEPGTYTLDIGFRTTRDKVVHAKLRVAEAPLPRVIGWGLLAAVAVTVLLLGLRSVLSRGTAGEAAPPP
ncbi:MAG TPA: hypothetical protein VK447_10600 [Myxococcaceae bacterium]|nr:hypothetical protein [Myxococcaceae bacterium]